jgi:hypothetical protein
MASLAKSATIGFLLVDSMTATRIDRAQSEEGVEDALIDQIELGLEGIEACMKTASNDLTISVCKPRAAVFGFRGFFVYRHGLKTMAARP